MSSTKAPTTSKAITSKGDPSGTYRPDPMFRMHQMEPGTQQNPARTIKQLQTILNPAGAGAAVMKKQQAIYNKGRP